MTPFVIWVATFYALWGLIVWHHDWWRTVVEHWSIALAMFFGSYVAGSTPMGGGTVGFPVLVMLMGEAPALGRDFSFAIQSIGMTSASIYIVCRRMPLAETLLRWGMLGSLIGTPLGVLFIAPHVPDLAMKMLFAVIWAGFGMMTLAKLDVFANQHGSGAGSAAADRRAGFAVGFLGGACVAAVIGVGIDLLLYAVLVLRRGADLKVAIPTSVVLMAFTSVVGLLSQEWLGGGMSTGVWPQWIAAAPVVALGAPLGALVVHAIGRKPTLAAVAVLCVLQFAWTCWREWPSLGAIGFGAALTGLLLCNGMFLAMYHHRRRPAETS